MPSQPEEDATISFPSIAVVAIIGFLIYRYFFASPSTASSRSNNGLRFTTTQVDTVSQMFPQLSRRDIMWDLQRNRGSVQATTERVLQGRGLDPVGACSILASIQFARTDSRDMLSKPTGNQRMLDIVLRIGKTRAGAVTGTYTCFLLPTQNELATGHHTDRSLLRFSAELLTFAPPSFQPILPQATSPSSGTRTSGIFSKPKPVEPDLITRYNLQSRIASSDKGKAREEPEAQVVESSAMATKEDRQKMLQRRRDEMILQARRKMMEKDGLRSTDNK